MELTIYLAQVFGLLLIISGVAMLVRGRFFVSAVHAIADDRLSRVLVAFIATTAGLFMVLAYNDWSTLTTGLISLLGWLTLIKGILYFFISDEALRTIVRKVATNSLIVVWGIIYLIIGIYLANVGFNWF